MSTPTTDHRHKTWVRDCDVEPAQLGQLAEAYGPLALLAALLAGLWRAISTGALKPRATVTEITDAYKHANVVTAEAHADALTAEREHTATERGEKEYWRDTAIRLLEVGERMAESTDGT